MDILSRKHALLTSMQVKVVGLEMVEDPKVRDKHYKKNQNLKQTIRSLIHLETEFQTD